MPTIIGFPPIASPDARLLILGSMPSAASLAAGQYYAHPRNLFWRLLGGVLGEALADLPYPERPDILYRHGIALWDVLASCERAGSLDSAIVGDSMRINDFAAFFAAHPCIGQVFFNGGLAARTFRRHVVPGLNRSRLQFTGLPSSSPAHAARGYAEKLACWREALGKAPLLKERLP